jgi:acetoacetyl-CoA synthetase
MILWTPSKEEIKSAEVSAFISNIEKKEGLKFKDYHAFQRWTAENPAVFWHEFSEFSGIKFTRKPDSILENAGSMPGARWFKGAELNYTENLLRFNNEKKALVFWNENGFQKSYSYSELRIEVLKLRKLFIDEGVKKGDAVAAFMPNIPETIISFLAAASIGALWTSASPDFSATAVCERFSQINPKVLIVSDGYFYKGKKISTKTNFEEIKEKIKSIQKVLITPYAEGKGSFPGLVAETKEITFESFPSEHPLFVLFSSGTTGKPKGLVHGNIGILLEHAKEHLLEAGIKREDVVFYNTTCGWMMWNWLTGVLFQGATLVLYDGFPLQKSSDEKKHVLFEMLEKEKVTIFGTSASFIQRMEEIGIHPKRDYKLPRLRSILSTGSRLKPASFDYIYNAFGKIHLSPIWGGTDLCGCLGISSPILPVRRGEIQTAGLGLDLDVFDENCKSLINIPGEIIVRRPFPSMPLYFLNDPDGQKYKASYFEHFPGVWRHGDLGIITENHGIIILGRSDDTLNPGGVRIGASEVTQAAESVEEVSEAMAVPKESGADEIIVLFVIMKANKKLTEKIKKKILNAMPSPRHKPKEIYEVPDFPTTISGKRSAKTARDILRGIEPSNLQALANPGIIEIFKKALPSRI